MPTPIKVMSGDRIDIFGKSYYNLNGQPITLPSINLIVTDLLASLLSTPQALGSTHGGITSAMLDNSSANSNGIGSFLDNHPAQTSSKPKAFINWMLFDEQFNFVAGGSSPVGSSGVVKTHYNDPVLQNISVSKNGYLFVFCSNESPVGVFFDNLQIIHSRGPILQEDHYYPFGLTMAGISNQAALSLENGDLYNGKELQHKEFSDGTGLEMYDFMARMQDPQLGVWHNPDPLADFYGGLSPYSYGANNPLRFSDPDGMNIIDIPGGIRIDGDDIPAAWNVIQQRFGTSHQSNHADNSDNPTPAPDDIIGTENYYRFRDEDSRKRYKGYSPSYYMSYGDKCIRIFKHVLYPLLSSDGKLWLIKTLIYLQEAMETGLKNDPEIEKNDDKFSDFAFSTHPAAYEKAGVLKLGVADKVQILLTPDASDLFSPARNKAGRSDCTRSVELL